MKKVIHQILCILRPLLVMAGHKLLAPTSSTNKMDTQLVQLDRRTPSPLPTPTTTLPTKPVHWVACSLELTSFSEISEM